METLNSFVVITANNKNIQGMIGSCLLHYRIIFQRFALLWCADVPSIYVYVITIIRDMMIFFYSKVEYNILLN